MSLKRRHFLAFMGTTAAIAACQPSSQTQKVSPNSTLAFQPVKLPIPLDLSMSPQTSNRESYQTYEVVDDLVLPEGYTYDLIASWGDRVGESRFGYNNDFVSFVETGSDEGLLTINFEYISGKAWMQSYETVIGQSLPFDSVRQRLATQDGKIDAFKLSDQSLKADIDAISKEGLIDHWTLDKLK